LARSPIPARVVQDGQVVGVGGYGWQDRQTGLRRLWHGFGDRGWPLRQGQPSACIPFRSVSTPGPGSCVGTG